MRSHAIAVLFDAGCKESIAIYFLLFDDNIYLKFFFTDGSLAKKSYFDHLIFYGLFAIKCILKIEEGYLPFRFSFLLFFCSAAAEIANCDGICHNRRASSLV